MSGLILVTNDDVAVMGCKTDTVPAASAAQNRFRWNGYIGNVEAMASAAVYISDESFR